MNRWWGWAVLAGVLLVGSVAGRVAGLGAAVRGWNFGYSYVAVRAVEDGVDPYHAGALIGEDSRLGLAEAIPLGEDSAQYPPSTLAVLRGLGGLGWPGAAWVFWGLSAGLLVGACAGLLRAQRGAWPGALAVMAGMFAGRPFLQAMLALNMVLPCVGLLVVASLLLREGGGRRRWMGAAALGVALALKPQVALGSGIFLLWRPASRVGARWGWAGFAGWMVAGCGWMRWRLGSFAFLGSLARLTLWTSGGGHQLDAGPANPASRGFLQVQALLLEWPGVGRLGANLVTGLVVLGLAAAIWWVGTRAGALEQRPWTMLALMEVWVLLFVYHRQYDRVMALLVVPAVVEVGRRSRVWGWGLGVLVVGWVVWDAVLERVWPGGLRVAWSPVMELLMCGWMLAALWRQRGSSRLGERSRGDGR